MQGQIISERYVVDKPIGRGGMATVYKGYDSILKRTIAIKILHKQFTNNAHFIERFRREAFAAASLIHPNITTIYDTGYANGVYYIIMEYVHGRTLKHIIDEYAPLSVHEAVDITRQIAGALGHAHNRKIIHRDIKPHNIIVTPDHRVKVTDFGIARAMAMPGLTQTGKILGTARYIAPEQARGQQANEQSDIYSLGVILYEMLTKRALFEGSSSIEVAEKHVTERPIPIRNINSDVPVNLEVVLERMLQKNLDERYTDVSKLLEDLSVWESREKQEFLQENGGTNPNTRSGRHAAKRSRSKAILDVKEERTSRSRTARIDNKRTKPKKRSQRMRFTPFAKTLLVTILVIGTALSVRLVFVAPSGDVVVSKKPSNPVKSDVKVEGLQVSMIVPLEAVDYDPDGNGDENPSQVSRVFDNNPKTAWSTESYRSNNFGHLKNGVGVYLDYGTNSTMKGFTILSGGGWSGTLKGSNDLLYWSELKDINRAEKTTIIKLSDTTYRYYLIWMTKLSASGDGKYRSKVNEVQARGIVY